MSATANGSPSWSEEVFTRSVPWWQAMALESELGARLKRERRLPAAHAFAAPQTGFGGDIGDRQPTSLDRPPQLWLSGSLTVHLLHQSPQAAHVAALCDGF